MQEKEALAKPTPTAWLPLAALIPPEAGLVIEYGDSRGLLESYFRGVNPFARYISSAEPEPRPLPEEADCIILHSQFADRLPAVLPALAERLREQGQLLVVVPNLYYWQNIRSVLEGRDIAGNNRMSELKAAAAAATLELLDIRPLNLTPASSSDFLAKLKPALDSLEIDVRRFAARSQSSHLLVRIVKHCPDRRFFLQALLGETKVCSRVRIAEPHRFLATLPGVRTTQKAGGADLALAQPGEEKVFIWQRIWPQNVAQQRELIRRGYLVVAEIDDDPLRWREYHEANGFFAFSACHAVQTSTEPLAEYLRQFNPQVAVFPNQLAWLPPFRPVRRTEPLTLFFGALNREEDWQPILPALNRLLQNYGDRLRVKVIHDRLFYDALTTPHKDYIPFCPYEKYLEVLQSCDIAILPLEPTRFNTMKSDLKYLECAANSVAVLASPTVYAGSIRHGQTGFLYHSPEEFGQHFTRLIEDVCCRESMIKQAYRWAADQRLLSRHYRQRLNWYGGLLSNLPELNRQLCARHPELFT